MHVATFIFLGLLTGASAVQAAGTHTYWAGFRGHVSQVMWPADPVHAKDRYLTITVALAREPKVKPVVFDNAFRAVCQRHQGEMRKAARALAPQNDWRATIRFHWPSGTEGIAMHRQASVWLSNCRPAKQ